MQKIKLMIREIEIINMTIGKRKHGQNFRFRLICSNCKISKILNEYKVL